MLPMYRYETHCHNCIASACATITPEQTVELYLKNGYTGIFVTDHFLNGNAVAKFKYPDADYKTKAEAFCEGYRAVKRAAGDSLQVFFGFEYSYLGTDILVYGMSCDELLKRSEILDMSMREFCVYCKENDLLAVQAHPFREARYIDHIRLYPDAEGVETFNANRTELCNKLGKFYAESYGKIETGGSDLHKPEQKILSGIETEVKFNSERDMINAVRAGKTKIFVTENIYTP